MGLDGDVTRVEVGRGGGRRRWWPFVVGGLVLWVLAAVVSSTEGSNDEEPRAGPATTTTSDRPTTSTTRRPRTTTTTAAIAGAPLLGRPTGWTLLVDGNRTVDLDTGDIGVARLGGVQMATHRGVVTSSADGLVWRPFPFDDATAVPLSEDTSGSYLRPAGSDAVWFVSQEVQPMVIALVGLDDGSVRARVELASGAWLVGATDRAAVVGAGGNTYVVGVDGDVQLFADASPLAVAGGAVLATACDGDLRCATYRYELDTGRRREIPGLPSSGWFSIVAINEQGWGLAEVYGFAERQTVVLVGPEGETIPFPDDLPIVSYRYAWTPDGAHLLVGDSDEILVIDPFADGGPAVVTSFPLAGRKESLVVLEAPEA